MQSQCIPSGRGSSVEMGSCRCSGINNSYFCFRSVQFLETYGSHSCPFLSYLHTHVLQRPSFLLATMAVLRYPQLQHCLWSRRTGTVWSIPLATALTPSGQGLFSTLLALRGRELKFKVFTMSHPV